MNTVPETHPDDTVRKLVRVVVEIGVTGIDRPSQLIERLTPALEGSGCDSPRFLATMVVPRDSPTAEELVDNLTQYLLVQFPECFSDVYQNIMVVNMLTTALGASLSYPLRNSTPDTTDGPDVVEKVLAQVRSTAYQTAQRAEHLVMLNSLDTDPKKAN